MNRMEISEISNCNGRIEWKSCPQNGNDCNGKLQWMTLAGFRNYPWLYTNPLEPVHDISCDHFTIALLNVRSIVAKLPDINANNSLRSASVLCFSETWLNGSQPSRVA